MKQAKPCGSWPSKIGSAELVQGALRLSAPRIVDGVLYWIEGRPSEGGRQVLMSARLAAGGGVGSIREAGPAESNVRTRVHEYGGGEYTVAGGHLFFVDDRDGCIHRARPGGSSTPISRGDSRFADLVVSPDLRWLVAVEERPREGEEPENRLVVFSTGLAGGEDASSGSVVSPSSAPPRVVAAGHDFYASPVFSPSGQRLAFLAWDHPNMPWSATCLESLAWSESGPAGTPRVDAGGVAESIFQPRFAPDGSLLAVSDGSGWWNLARIGETGLEPIHRVEAELGRAQWVFGMSSWDFLSNYEILASATFAGVDRLLRIDRRTGGHELLALPFERIDGLDADGTRGVVAFIAGSATAASALHLWDPETGDLRCVRASSTLEVDSDAVAGGDAMSFELPDGRTTHAFVYHPASATHAPRSGERPPLLVKSHGGPTSSTSSAFDPRIQYWTSRGFAVADVNYAGSTGYGRRYRDLLELAWGIVDVEDCVFVARALAREGVVDGERLAISGGSAGGFTTLCALTFHDTFAAGASHYGIGDLEALARDTHKFESRYTDWLVGEWPRDRARYVERSPIHHHEELACPVIFFQGLDDRIVPPNQAEAMVSVLERRGIPHAYVPFEGEGHGFRRAENIRTALDGELYFYSRVFGFDAPRLDAVRVVGVEAG